MWDLRLAGGEVNTDGALTKRRARDRQLSLYPSDELREKLRRIAAQRGTSDASTGVWLLARAVDRFLSLSPEEQDREEAGDGRA